MAILVFFTLFLNVGSSTFSTWWLATWIKAGGGVNIFHIFIHVRCISFLNISISYLFFLFKNITDPNTNETIVSDNLNDNPDFMFYHNIYGATIGVILLTSLLRGVVITFTTISASTTLHNKVFKKMIESSLTFFETTPSGRLQNIFSRDVDEGKVFLNIFKYVILKCNFIFLFIILLVTVDNNIPICIENMVQNIFTCSFAIIFICSILPWFCLPLFILGAMFYYISKVFR